MPAKKNSRAKTTKGKSSTKKTSMKKGSKKTSVNKKNSVRKSKADIEKYRGEDGKLNWIGFVKFTQQNNPGMTYGEAMSEARQDWEEYRDS